MSKKNIWKSIEEYQDNPEVLKAKLDEFKEGVTDEFSPEDLNKVSRRKFLAVLAASTAYAATACTSYRDKGEIVPYVDRPEEILPGKPTYYASTIADEGISYGVLVKTREGRPIKIEGNPDDIINKGKIPSKIHASILNLYDPDRLKNPKINGLKTSWEKAYKELDKVLIKAGDENKEIALITGKITSPTTKKIIDDFVNKYPTTKIYKTQLVNDSNRSKAWDLGHNLKVIPSIKWDEAKVIIALESDFLGKEGNTIENRVLYAKSRDIVNTKQLSKLYSIESGMSLTGMNSDVRLRLKPQKQFEFLLSLLAELNSRNVFNKSLLNSNVSSLISGKSISKFAEMNGLKKERIDELLKDIIYNKGKVVFHAGDALNVETHLLVNLINEILDASSLYNFKNAIKIEFLSEANEIKSLTENINNGKVAAIINFDSNPIYNLSENFGLKESIKKIENVISISDVPNETTALSKFILPANNALESWGDHQTRLGQYTLQQPVIEPLFNTMQKEAILLSLISKKVQTIEDFHKYLKSWFKENIFDKGSYASNFEQFWLTALHDGVVNFDTNVQKYEKLDQTKIKKPNFNESGITLVLNNNYNLGSGKFANNGWLQELPHPVTKVTWDNFAAIAPSTAEKYKLKNNDVISVKVNGKEAKLPVMIQPGMTEETIVAEFGYGRKNSGEVAEGVGVSLNSLLGTSSISNYVLGGVEIEKTSDTYELASTQEHHSLNDEFVKDFHRIRRIIQEGTLEEYNKNPNFLHEEKHDIFSITNPHEYKNEKWAMSIDLNKCLGCSECVSSCNVENNIPVVGKDQVMVGREMHWIRIDRYYSGTPEEPIVSTQPMLCQHCDNAPCENVCPVNATNHSPDGLNQMAYNRCVGTRYCANNCPYKVRRFNFYNFRDHFEDAYYENELSYLVNNPEVTVRSRGVIEKCSFCIQNIMEVREKAIREGREIFADEIKTSCQTACPSDAIVFGDSNNDESTVTKHREHELSYHVLEELNVRPNVTYLAKIRNTRTEEL